MFFLMFFVHMFTSQNWRSFTKLPHACPNERHKCAKNWSENLPQIHRDVVIYPCVSGGMPGQILMDACGKITCHFLLTVI